MTKVEWAHLRVSRSLPRPAISSTLGLAVHSRLAGACPLSPSPRLRSLEPVLPPLRSPTPHVARDYPARPSTIEYPLHKLSYEISLGPRSLSGSRSHAPQLWRSLLSLSVSPHLWRKTGIGRAERQPVTASRLVAKVVGAREPEQRTSTHQPPLRRDSLAPKVHGRGRVRKAARRVGEAHLEGARLG